MTLEAWLVTDVGVVRDHNEDSAFMEPTQGFFIVADGMGGHAAGEVASAMAVETVRTTLEAAKPEIDAFKRAPTDAGRRGLVQLLQNAVLQAHQAVFQRGQTETDKQGMGTTLDVVLVAGAEAFVAHVGDSRTYLVRDGKSSQITTDHTVAEVLVIEGKLTIEEAQVSPLRTILVNAIGVSADVGVEMAHVTLKQNDRLLLCSDGLHDYFPVEEEIAQRMSADKPGEALKEMVELAKTRGGHDNITGVAVLVAELVEAAVPHGMNEDSTQPVDIQGNPFAADEPTQTAASNTLLGSQPEVEKLRQTQPMRAIDIATMPTVPPPIKEEAEKAAKEAKAKKDTKPEAKDSKSEAKDAKPEAKDSKPEAKDAKPEAKDAKDTKPEAKNAKPEAKDAKPEAKDAKPEAKDAKDASAEAAQATSGDGHAAKSDDKEDGVPLENVATADTGRMSVPKKD
ncbi:MAG TPA: protein phosphatase 2C domain-containing protein [Kofleriaceae bacterium]|nr:protein phosphatase 2C domain-containing protein [Kofleriaceae bacterium]